MYPDDRVATFITEHFLPARVHVRDDSANFQRFGERYAAHWTPTILELDPDGTERHRIEGFLDTDDFLAQLKLGLGKGAFKREQWQEAAKWFREVADKYPNTDAAPEALYWAGVSRYKETGDGKWLGETARAFSTRYQESTWAKKSSIWKA